MPVIPEYSQTEKPLGESRNVLANPTAMSSSWRGVEALGADIANVGSEVSSAIMQVQDRQNKISAHDAANKYQTDIESRKAQVLTIEGDSVNHYSSMSGKDDDANTDLYTGESSQLPTVRAKYAESLDPKARLIFNQLADDTDKSYRSKLATHQASETRAHNAKVVADTFDIAKQNIIDNPSEENIAKQVARVKDVIAIHHGKADTELAEKMELDLHNVAKNRRNADKVTTEVVSLQREMKEKYPDDPVRALDEALSKATGPDWREDAMKRGIDETVQQRIVSQLSSSLVQQDKIYKNKVNKSLTDFTLLLDGNGLDPQGKPIPGWRDKIHEFIYDKDRGLNGEDQKKFLHMANEKIDRELKEVRASESEKRHAKQESEHIDIERRRLKLDKQKDEREAHLAKVADLKGSVLQRIVSGEIKDNIDIANTPGMDADTFKSLVPVLKDINSSVVVKDAYKTVDTFVKSRETDPIKQKQMLADMHDKLHVALAGKTDKKEVQAVVDDLMKDHDSHFVKDAIKNIGDFFKPKDAADKPAIAPSVIPSVDKTHWDKRADGTTKGTGFLGLIPRPDGKVSSEISIGVKINGKEVEIPTLVPTLTKKEVDYLINNPVDVKLFKTEIGKAIKHKAGVFAEKRIAAGKSPFASDSESPKASAPENVKAPSGYTYDSSKGYWVNPNAPKGKKAWKP